MSYATTLTVRDEGPRSTRRKVMAAYRQRFRRWTMEALPDMPPEQWERLLDWVTAFGYKHADQRPAKRFKRQVTGTVTSDKEQARLRKERTRLWRTTNDATNTPTS